MKNYKVGDIVIIKNCEPNKSYGNYSSRAGKYIKTCCWFAYDMKVYIGKKFRIKEIDNYGETDRKRYYLEDLNGRQIYKWVWVDEMFEDTPYTSNSKFKLKKEVN